MRDTAPRTAEPGDGLAPSPGDAIAVSGLTKRYRGSRDNAVDNVSFNVAEGQHFCLLGPNGAGKTTIVSILTTTLVPTAGSVTIAGRDVATEQALVRRELGIVFQQQSLDLNLTAEENIRLHAMLYGMYPWRPAYRLMPSDYRRQVAELASTLGVTDILQQRAGRLSGGMRRRLEIARALLHRPHVLFLDEPTVGLDPESRRNLWRYIEDVRHRLGTTVFLTTHYLEEAETADTVCVLAHGRIVEHGSPAEVKARHAQPELVLDSAERERLQDELLAMELAPSGHGPFRVAIEGINPQRVLRRLHTDITQFQIVEPTLEDAYLLLLERCGR